MDTVNLLAEIEVLKRRLENAVEVVRCKECRHRVVEEQSWGEYNEYCDLWCDGNGYWASVNADDFCSYGEREGEWIEGKYDLMCSNCENTQEYEKFPYCPYCGAKMTDRKTEPQTEKPNIWKRIDKPFRAVWLDDDHNEIGTPQTDCPWQNDEHIPTELASTMLKKRFKEQK